MPRKMRCDWCKQLKYGIRIDGPLICDECWSEHIRQKKAKEAEYIKATQKTGKRTR